RRNDPARQDQKPDRQPPVPDAPGLGKSHQAAGDGGPDRVSAGGVKSEIHGGDAVKTEGIGRGSTRMNADKGRRRFFLIRAHLRQSAAKNLCPELSKVARRLHANRVSCPVHGLSPLRGWVRCRGFPRLLWGGSAVGRGGHGSPL